MGEEQVVVGDHDVPVLGAPIGADDKAAAPKGTARPDAAPPPRGQAGRKGVLRPQPQLGQISGLRLGQPRRDIARRPLESGKERILCDAK